MKIEICDQRAENSELKNVGELLKSFIYICTRKLWRAQIIVLVLLGIASLVFLSTLFYYDAIREELVRQRDSVVVDVEDAKHDEVLIEKTIEKPYSDRPKHKKILLTPPHKKYPNYYDDDLHTEWTFQISKTYDESHLHGWTEPLPPIKHRKSSHGENGTKFIVPEHMKPLMQELQEKHKYNLLASQMISVNRSLPDMRYDECRDLSYPEKLPTTSVIIIFHNEAWHTLMRTIWSVINRSPRQLIEEIVLVDDLSTEESLKQPLDDYIQKLPVRVKVIRTDKREGLIRSRLLGSKAARVSIILIMISFKLTTKFFRMNISGRHFNIL